MNKNVSLVAAASLVVQWQEHCGANPLPTSVPLDSSRVHDLDEVVKSLVSQKNFKDFVSNL